MLTNGLQVVYVHPFMIMETPELLHEERTGAMTFSISYLYVYSNLVRTFHSLAP
jgi:hypothetical protein